MSHRLRCLAITPHPREALTLAKLVESEGHHFTRAASIAEGLDAMAALAYDLAIVDMPAPVAEGPTFFRNLRDELAREDTAVLLLGPPPPDIIRAELDAMEILPKPLNEVRIQRTIRWLLDGPRVDGLTPPEFRQFCTHLQRVSGLVFDAKRKSTLAEALRRRMRLVKCDSYVEYLGLLLAGPQAQAEEQRLVRLLTVGETSFFRNPPHFAALRERIFPALRRQVESTPGRRISLWSAGCSTGEEAYSLAIAALELFPEADRGVVRISATDINLRSLTAARRGIYEPRYLRGLSDEYRDRYFEPLPDGRFQVAARVRSLVRFDVMNLQTGDYPAVNDVIFCRNVLIYFDRRHYEEAIVRMRDSLRPGGWLFLGHSENLLGMDVGLDVVHDGDTYYYRRPLAVRPHEHDDELDGAGPGEPHRPSPDRPRQPARAPASGPRQPEPSRPDPPAVREGRPSRETATDLGLALRRTLPRESALATLGESSRGPGPASPAPAASGGGSTEAEREFAPLLDQGLGSPLDLVGRGFLAANRGDLAEARRLAEEALARDSLLAEAHFLLGVLRADAGQTAQAMQSFTRSLFLKPELPMAHYHMAHLLEKDRRFGEARKELENAIELLEGGVEAEFTGGFPPGQLLAICRQSLARLASRGGTRR